MTADLGLVFDESYRGPGLKLAEILKHGPADKRGLALHARDVIVSIDRQPVTDSRELSELLNGKAGETVPIEFVSAGLNAADPKNRRMNTSSMSAATAPPARTAAGKARYQVRPW